MIPGYFPGIFIRPCPNPKIDYRVLRTYHFGYPVMFGRGSLANLVDVIFGSGF